jgi:hypothetical protein
LNLEAPVAIAEPYGTDCSGLNRPNTARTPNKQLSRVGRSACDNRERRKADQSSIRRLSP